jgi:hypothetical protein
LQEVQQVVTLEQQAVLLVAVPVEIEVESQSGLEVLVATDLLALKELCSEDLAWERWGP